MAVLKWLFNALLFLWLYHAIVRPLFLGLFYGGAPSTPKSKPQQTHAHTSTPTGPAKKLHDDVGEYVDYEDIK